MKTNTRFIQRIAYSNIYEIEGVGLIFQAGLDIDADGSPHAYAARGAKDAHGKLIEPLDYLVNAKDQNGHFVGIATDGKGAPHVQGPHDPAPGYYVSTTSLQDKNLDVQDQKRYLDSERVPFFVMPNVAWFTAHKCGLGAVGLAYYRKQATHSFFVVGDVGPMHKIGEGSIALARSLWIDSNAKFGGCANGVVYIIFSDTVQPMVRVTSIIDQGSKAFDKWGGMKELLATIEELFS